MIHILHIPPIGVSGTGTYLNEYYQGVKNIHGDIAQDTVEAIQDSETSGNGKENAIQENIYGTWYGTRLSLGKEESMGRNHRCVRGVSTTEWRDGLGKIEGRNSRDMYWSQWWATLKHTWIGEEMRVMSIVMTRFYTKSDRDTGRVVRGRRCIRWRTTVVVRASA